jgi:hypothetical protein
MDSTKRYAAFLNFSSRSNNANSFLRSFTPSCWMLRDYWLGWEYRHQYDRLHLVANNSRFLILPHYHYKNQATRILFLCRRKIQKDGIDRFEFPLLVLETFVDPSRFTGTIYKVANWNLVDKTKEYQRMRNGYSNTRQAPKLVFVQLF